MYVIKKMLFPDREDPDVVTCICMSNNAQNAGIILGFPVLGGRAFNYPGMS